MGNTLAWVRVRVFVLSWPDREQKCWKWLELRGRQKGKQAICWSRERWREREKEMLREKDEERQWTWERGEKRRLNKIEGCGVAGRLSEACQKHSRWVSFIFSLRTAVRLAVVLLVALWLCFSALTGWDQCFSTGGSPFQNGPQPVIIKVVYDTWRNLPVWVTIHLHKHWGLLWLKPWMFYYLDFSLRFPAW